ncbi:MAG: hypothetical protein ACXW31_00485 [Thermoanaerobaculia bacterium]
MSRRNDLLILGAILLALAVLRFSLHSGPGPYGSDGSYYAQIARNFAEGRGLVTNVSLYHQGLDPLPAPTNIYPAWPVVLGAAARVMGLVDAVWHVPRLFYLLALSALYVLVRRIGGDVGVFGSFNVAHLSVLLMGLTPVFFSSTTYPYTEGLAFTLASLTLLTAFRQEWFAALGGGILAGLATLTRSQMLLLVLAIILVRAYEAVRDGRWKNLVLSVAGVALVFVPWLAYVSTFTGSFALRHLHVSYQQTPEIAPYSMGAPVDGPRDLWLLRLKGALTAFNPFSAHSFVALYGAAALLVPIAAVHSVHRAFRKKLRITPGVLAVAVSGSLLAGMLVLLPQRYFRPWLFGWRHGLPFIFLIVLSLVELIGYGHRYVRTGAIVLAFVSILTGGVNVARTVMAGPPPGPTRAERELLDWLDRQPPSVVVLTTNAQSLSVYTHANFRWAACDDSPAVVESILRKVRTDYVAAYESESACTFGSGLAHLVQREAVFGVEPNRILLLRRRPGVFGPAGSTGDRRGDPHRPLEQPQNPR